MLFNIFALNLLEIKFNMRITIASKRNINSLLLSGLTILAANAQKSNAKATAENPNLIFIISDQLRLDALSCMGNKIISTPNMDRLAAEGVIFTRAYSQSPVSVPSRSCMLTGNSLCNTGILGNDYAYESSVGSILTGKEPIFSTKTYDEVLATNGYDCEYYGKWHSPERKAYIYSNRPIGCAGITVVPELGIGLKAIYVNWWKTELKINTAPFQTGAFTGGGGDLYYMPDATDARKLDPTITSTVDYQNFGNLLIDDAHTESAMDTKKTLDAIERNKNNRFSIHCSFGPPHPPFVVAKPYFGSLKESDMPLPDNFFINNLSSPYYNTTDINSPYYISSSMKSSTAAYFQSVAVAKNFKARYLEMVKEIDDKLGEILKKLDDTGLAANTMIVFCADHGEMLGSHGLNSKGVFYDESARVPLIIRYPNKIAAGKKITVPVSLIDLRPTIEDYLEMPSYKCDGKTLRPFIDNSYDKTQNYYTVSEWNSTKVPAFMVRNERYKLMMGQTSEVTSIDGFFDMKTDSLEQNNLLLSSIFTQTDRANAENAKLMLVKWLKKVNSPYYYSVKARAIGKKFSTYALYKNDVAKINGAKITALSNLPSGVTYRILQNDTLEITVSNNANAGVYNLNATVSGTNKSISFEILPEFASTVPVTGITVEPTSASIAVGNTQQLRAVLTPWNVTNNAVSWKTTNSLVAKVNANGLVTAYSAGTTSITATSEDGGKTATFEITVTGEKIPVSGINIVPASTSIETNNTLQLIATILPANATFKSVTWTTSNPSVATVSEDGLITSIAAGISNITATALDGGKSAIFVLNVTQGPITLQAENATFSGAVLASSQAGYNGTGYIDFVNSLGDFLQWNVNVPNAGNYNLTIRYALQGGYRPLELSVNGSVKIASLDFPITGSWTTWWTVSTTQTLNAGANSIKLTSNGNNGGNIDELVVTSIVAGTKDVFSFENSKSVSIYPNPISQNKLSFDIAGFRDMNNVQIKIVNLIGQIVYQKRIDNIEHLEINTAGILEKSIYIVSVESGKYKLTSRLIVN